MSNSQLEIAIFEMLRRPKEPCAMLRRNKTEKARKIERCGASRAHAGATACPDCLHHPASSAE